MIKPAWASWREAAADAARRWAPWLVPSALLAAAFVLRVSNLETFELFQDKVFDTYQSIRPRSYRPVPVRVVDIDDESLTRLGSWPWPRSVLAELTSRLSSSGAATIVFDIVFPEPGRNPGGDAAFARAISEARVVTGFTMTSRPNASRPALKAGFAFSGDDPFRFLADFPGAVGNIPAIEAAAAGDGCFGFLPEKDGVIRRVPLLLRKGAVIYPSLAAEALRVYQGAPDIIVKSSGARGVRSFGQHTGISEIKAGSVILPTDGGGRFWVHYSESVPRRVIPAWRVMAADFPKDALKGDIVFVGASALRLQDLRATPLHPAVPGVEIQAQIAEQALLGDDLHRPDWADGVEIVFMLLLGALLILLLPRLGAAWCGALGLSLAAAAFPLSWWAYARLHWLFDPLFPALTALAIYTASSLIAHLRDEAERKRLLILDAVKDEFISTVSHDLRGPVSAMVMGVQALRAGLRGPLTDAQKRDLRMIENAGRKLLSFVSNVLDAAKIKAGKMELVKAAVDPREILAPIAEVFALTASAKGVTLEEKLPDGLPAVEADREKLEQVINNLVTNAIKFTPKGGRITLSAARDEGFVRFSVADTGLGIAAEDVPKLFKSFQQVDVARQKELKIVGTGLGLSICKTIAEAHGGRIWVESEKGKGSTFHVTIPLAAARA